jgi:hypothetical protein
MDTRHVGRLTFDDFVAVATIDNSISLTQKKLLPSAFGDVLALQTSAPQRTVRLDPALNKAILRRVFQAIDTDHDGEISFEEFRRYYGS